MVNLLKNCLDVMTAKHSVPSLAGETDAGMEDPLITFLGAMIRLAVRVMAILMTAVILWGVVDIVWVLYQHLLEPPYGLLTISDILETFGAFMAVLIAIEIFTNITVYLRDDVIHVQIVMATALMAIARKIIILDADKLDAGYLYGLAAIVLAMSIGYWLVVVKDDKRNRADH